MIFRNKKISEKHYKFKELKTYSSTEWLSEGRKRYRSVFESMETTYIYAEFSFYNKLFDIEDWDAAVNLKCFRVNISNERELLCNINVEHKVSKEEPIICIREGWGNQQAGIFWTRGDYTWEAYIDNELVGTKAFYVENGGLVTETENPYFILNEIKLYEGPNQGTPAFSRTYYRKFDHTDTRYVWAEVVMDNVQEEDWFCELSFQFVNSTGQVKGRTVEIRRINKEDEEISITTGWGSDSRGSWFPDKYLMQVTFMDKLIAVVPFEVTDGYEEGDVKILDKGSLFTVPAPSEEEEEGGETLEEMLTKVEAMEGLSLIKQKIKDYTQYIKFIQLRKEKGLKEEHPIQLHAVFKGNPGTGKTTIAKMLGRIYHQMGLLSKGKVLEVGRAELVGQYIGQTAPKVKEVIEKARGGILFIDEAYSLIRNNEDSKDYGHEVVETIVKELSDGKGDLAIIVAGYPNEMDTFLNSNPGLKSRFKMFFDFEDYLPQELSRIADIVAQRFDVSFTQEAKELLDRKITQEYRKRDYTFGNARTVVSLMEEVKMNLGLRVMKETNAKEVTASHLRTIMPDDVKPVFLKRKKELPNISVDEEQLTEALNELNGMIGLSEVKNQIYELVRLVRFYKETGKNVLNRFSLHSVFKGNPGTGKTTVARLLARIYHALGILEKGHIVECDRQSLVAGFIGQTAIKTKEKIDAAIGGVLFIDEAYALSSKVDTNDFGKEAIEVILKQMEDRRGEFIVIAAGYPENMEKFLETNPGLKSRFDRTLIFEDFSVEELFNIALMMFEEEKLYPDEEARKYMRMMLSELFARRDKYFGNARTVRKIVLEAVKKQHLRMAAILETERTKEMISTLSVDDIQSVRFNDDELTGRKRIGFRMTDS